jgi:hypothetical protein
MKNKYKFVEYSGCTSGGFTINDKFLEDISQKEQDEVLDYLFMQFKIQLKENYVQFQDFVKLFQYSDYQCAKHNCETCGDRWDQTQWEI